MNDPRDEAKPAELLCALYDAAVKAADAERATREALRRASLDGSVRCWIIAVGKGAHAMARGACEDLTGRGVTIAGGLVVAPDDAEPPHSLLAFWRGDHPLPGTASSEAAEALATLVRQVEPGDQALVLISGGTTSLIGAPIDGVTPEEYVRMFEVLLASGVDIRTMNAVRKRFSRWGGGRLATALAPARVRCLIASDVIGDDPASIASGPCVADPYTSAELLELIARLELDHVLPPRLCERLDATHRESFPETPKPDDAAFNSVSLEIVLGNRQALVGAGARAQALGLSPVVLVAEPLLDDAALTAERLVDVLIRFREGGLRGADDTADFACMIWGGETTVLLGSGAAGVGGRCQELALSAARALHDAGDRGTGVWLLAAGTDGRDGPTDAAGAIVDAETWNAIEAAGLSPGHALHTHDAYGALDAAGALIRVGLTGTNVGDVVVGLVQRA